MSNLSYEDWCAAVSFINRDDAQALPLRRRRDLVDQTRRPRRRNLLAHKGRVRVRNRLERPGLLPPRAGVRAPGRCHSRGSLVLFCNHSNKRE